MSCLLIQARLLLKVLNPTTTSLTLASMMRGKSFFFLRTSGKKNLLIPSVDTFKYVTPVAVESTSDRQKDYTLKAIHNFFYFNPCSDKNKELYADFLRTFQSKNLDGNLGSI